MDRRAFLRGSAVASAGLAAACTPLSLFNTLSPKDPAGGPRVAGVAYGDEPRQLLDVYPARGAGPHPTVVFVYGGSWASGRRQDYSWVGRALAAEGFLTILPDYRLVPEVRFPAFVDDVALAAAWAKANAKRFGGGNGPVFLLGHSAGAYNVAMASLDARFLGRAGLATSDIGGVVGISGPYDFFPFDVPASRNAFGAYPDPAATQPINFARGDAPPFLLLHGDADKTVLLRNSTALASKLKTAGAPVELKIYPGVTHAGAVLAFSRPFRSKAPTLADTTAFVRAHAGS